MPKWLRDYKEKVEALDNVALLNEYIEQVSDVSSDQGDSRSFDRMPIVEEELYRRLVSIGFIPAGTVAGN